MEEKCIDCKYSRQCFTMKQINSECCLKDRENEKKTEIKEILYLEKYIDKYKSDEKSIINGNRLTTPAMLDYLEVKNLLDYIINLQDTLKDREEYCYGLETQLTNLQEENEFLKLNNPEMNMEHFRIIKENKRKIDNLREENRQTKLLKERYQLEKEYYKSRNEKAIEYIKENMKGSQLVFGINDINRLYIKNMNDLLNILEGEENDN